MTKMLSDTVLIRLNRSAIEKAIPRGNHLEIVLVHAIAIFDVTRLPIQLISCRLNSQKSHPNIARCMSQDCQFNAVDQHARPTTHLQDKRGRIALG